MKKKCLSLLLITGLTVTMIAGCGSSGSGNSGNTGNENVEAESSANAEKENVSEENTAESGSAAGDAVTITMMGWYDEPDMEPILAEVNKQLGGTYVMEYTYVDNTNFNTVLSTQLAAGEGPDIIMDGSNFPAEMKAGNVEDISSYDFVSEFNEAGMALCTMGGKTYGIPSYGWFSGIWCNMDILNECGLEVPKTFDEFVADCETINAKGYTAYGFGLADDSTAYSCLMGYLENSFYHNNSANKDGIGFDEKFAMGEVTMSGNIDDCVNKWYTLIDKGLIAPESLGISCQEMLNTFKNGEVAFLHGGPWQYNELKESGVNFAMLPQLSETGEDVYVLGGPAACFGINVNTKNHDGAEAALMALASVEVQQAFADANVGGTSYRSGVTPSMPEEYDYVRDTINSGNIAFPSNRWAVNMPSQSLIDEMAAQLQGVISGDITADEFIKAIDTKADSIRYE